MRLGALFLTAAALAALELAAQGRQPLPWEGLQPLDWQAGPGSVPGAPYQAAPSAGSVEARLTADGTLSVKDARGIIRLQAGLPGRPLKAWRDGGFPLPAASGAWSFPAETPLVQGLGGLLWGGADFRSFLRGLLWVIEDGETVLTVVHPAAGRVIHLPLPPGRDLHLNFLPDRLEAEAGEVDQGAPRRWSIPWMGLLPRLAALAPQPGSSKAGSALAPFPKD